MLRYCYRLSPEILFIRNHVFNFQFFFDSIFFGYKNPSNWSKWNQITICIQFDRSLWFVILIFYYIFQQPKNKKQTNKKMKFILIIAMLTVLSLMFINTEAYHHHGHHGHKLKIKHVWKKHGHHGYGHGYGKKHVGHSKRYHKQKHHHGKCLFVCLCDFFLPNFYKIFIFIFFKFSGYGHGHHGHHYWYDKEMVKNEIKMKKSTKITYKNWIDSFWRKKNCPEIFFYQET